MRFFLFQFYFAVNSGLKLVWSELLHFVTCNPNANANGNVINAAFHLHQRPCHRIAASNSEESCELYLMRILTNPLSLKQQARIVIRNRLIGNITSFKFVQNFVLSHPKYQLNSNALESSSATPSPNSATTTNATNSQRIITTRSNVTHQTNSILECLIWQLEIPRCLHFYLYAFPDVPPIPETIQNITVFVND